ncbi:MAG: hypothetical protein DLM69_11170 [Candidatus Chloroheliales bacterium]|nr:MAG: hypothetical protein DLM69_11170 [Chloroflexota bacterium]
MLGKSDALPVGSQLQGGKYVIEAVLGQGSFGITYRAANTGSLLHKQVAIKELLVEGSQRLAGHVQHPPERSDESWGRLTANFEREAQTLARLKHSNIVTVHDAFAENGTIYIVMEFVDGTTLDQLVRQRGGKLPEDEALRYVAEIADALSVLHKNGVLHRDIKPANIVIDKPGHAMLIDFGTARDFVADKTLTHSVILTPAFAPPEQFQARARRGPYTDIYALAATTYWLLTGEAPAMGEADAVKDDTRLNPQIRTALAHALAFNSQERTQEAASFMRELLGPSAQPAAPPPQAEATSSVSGFQRGATADANATTIPNQPQPRQQWDAETYDESRGNQPPSFTASELASRQLNASSVPPRRSPWLAIGGGVAAAVLLGVLAIVLLGGNKGNGTNPPGGGASDTPTAGQVAMASPTAAPVAQAQATSTSTPVPPTNTATDTPALASKLSLPYSLLGVQMTSTNEGWAVGGGGTILHYSGGNWIQMSSPTTNTLPSVAIVSANEGWAVGQNGTILHYSGANWIQVSNPTTNTLFDVTMVSADEGWAVGENGTILHYSGRSWTKAGSPTDALLFSVAMVSANEGWAVGNVLTNNTIIGTILHYSDGSWTKMSGPNYVALEDVAMVSANEGWAVGDGGTILHYSGDSWMQVSSPTSALLLSVAMVSANEGWAVGENGTILHYSRDSWTQVSSPTNALLRRAAMISANEGWAVGNASPSGNPIGIILHYQNGVWSEYH